MFLKLLESLNTSDLEIFRDYQFRQSDLMMILSNMFDMEWYKFRWFLNFIKYLNTEVNITVIYPLRSTQHMFH